MNIYRHTFTATCPSDGENIVYRLEIRTTRMIMVEHLRTETALIKKGYHEKIADALAEKFGGLQIMEAQHQGIQIMTVRA
ncbi:hypothetical protein [Pseudomonas nitroreducens]|uniref:hypothetical protein n=1 Tax=Pseudomonas nitroreducens TaxID=46680 RepID=UPI002D80E0F3|nr:hypothetical protein [Pseudomonas nitroreducens]